MRRLFNVTVRDDHGSVITSGTGHPGDLVGALFGGEAWCEKAAAYWADEFPGLVVASPHVADV